MIISILGIVAQMEKSIGRERQLSGITIAKLQKDKYLGRAKETSEDV